MEKRISQASGCDALNTTAQDAQYNVQMLPPTMKECGYKSLKSPNCFNYYDGLFSASTEMKKELPEDEYPQSATAASCINKSGIDSNTVFENEELSTVPETQEIKQAVSEEIHDKKDNIIANKETSDESRILSNAGDASVLYNVRTTPQEIQPTMCGDILKNGFNLLTHNNEHIKIEPPTSVGNEENELHKCQCCDKYSYSYNFNHDNMLAHMDDAHSHRKHITESNVIRTNEAALKKEFHCDVCKKIFKLKSALKNHITSIHFDYGKTFECWCGKQFRTPIHLYQHKYNRHGANVKRRNDAALKTEFKCGICNKMLKSKNSLKIHITSIHYDYGKAFECWCGKQFRTPMHLYRHKSKQHSSKVKRRIDAALKKEFQCDVCKKMIKSKNNLIRHITSIHFDYGKKFECWCGKQFRTPIHLYRHKNKQHSSKVKRRNDAALKKEFQCDVCKKMIKSKNSLIRHITGIHFDYGKKFECWCGKQFRTPIHLYRHKNKQHSSKVKRRNDAALKKEFQCDVCKKMIKSKNSLIRHITGIHFDYGKKFECWCGKQFRTPIHLNQHKYNQHAANVKRTNDAALKKEFQCDVCKKMMKSKRNLIRHITSIHYDYGKTFECWCGKQFRTPIHLNEHKYNQHGANVIRTNEAALKKEFHCDVCKKIFKLKSALKKHITRIHYDYGKAFECWCGKQFRTPLHLNQHKYKQHGANVKRINVAALKKEFQCDVCKKFFKLKSALKKHITRIHYDYGKAFECWCGKQFRTPLHLNQHKYKQHGANVKRINVAALKKEFQCDVCKKFFKLKSALKNHITRIHYDYGKAFECWCWKQFRTPLHLNQHKYKQHGANEKRINVAALKKEFQCDVCKKMLKSKKNLIRHITSIHFDYGKTFECWCGKQFRTPIHLNEHKYNQHGANVKRRNDAALKKEFQCDVCKKMVKSKKNLIRHITSIHFDYGKTFECWCGKQFRTPMHLYRHKNKQHSSKVKRRNDAALKKEFQCDVCKKMIKSKNSLIRHITSIHFDYGKKFECWCGKQFRTPIHLNQHKYKQHADNVKRRNDAALKTEFKCGICNKMLKSKDSLKIHITSIHYDYGKTFECWCGKQFRTPIHLNQHKYKQHGANVKGPNDAALKKEFQCDVCKKMMKSKKKIIRHITSIHYDYGKTFNRSCGKRFV